MKICNFDLIILVIVMFFVVFAYDQIKNLINNKENFQSTTTGYQADIEAIRNLSSIATQLQAGGITVPGILTASGLTINERNGNPLIINSTKNSWLFNNYPNDDKLGIRGQDANGNWTDTRLSLSQKGDLKIASKLATNNLDPNNMPDGWGGGIRTFDIYGSGTIACGTDGKQLNAYLNRDGDGYFRKSLTAYNCRLGGGVGAYMVDGTSGSNLFAILCSIKNTNWFGIGDRDDHYFVLPGYRVQLFTFFDYLNDNNENGNKPFNDFDNTNGSQTNYYEVKDMVNRSSSLKLFFLGTEVKIAGVS
jgi:hypothetical protein